MQWEYRIESHNIRQQDAREQSLKKLNELGREALELLAVQIPELHG